MLLVRIGFPADCCIGANIIRLSLAGLSDGGSQWGEGCSCWCSDCCHCTPGLRTCGSSLLNFAGGKVKICSGGNSIFGLKSRRQDIRSDSVKDETLAHTNPLGGAKLDMETLADKKRRRNRKASARFRERNKEKEMDTIARLETQVRDLTKERDGYKYRLTHYTGTSNLPVPSHDLNCGSASIT